MKIKKIRSVALRNEAHLKFMNNFKSLILRYPEVESIVDNVIGQFNSELDMETKLVDTARKSRYTKLIADADRRRDRDIVGLNSAVDSGLHHFNPEVVEAARRIHLLIKSFRTAIESKPYQLESSAIEILVYELRSTYAVEVETLKIGEWVDELSAAQAEFDSLFVMRNSEWAARPNAKLRDVRKRVDGLYRAMVALVDSYGLLNGYGVTGRFVLRLNTEVKYFNDHVHHRAKVDIDAAAVESVPKQVYDGRPAVPMPEVYYDGERLVFTRDYVVSYCNNDRPGTAMVIVHGKGRFKGIKDVSFNIVDSG
jgi:hypothetical protein